MTFRGTAVYTSYFGDLGGGELRLLDHVRLSAIPRAQLAVIQFAPGPLSGAVQALGVESAVLPWCLGRPLAVQAWKTAEAAIRFARHLLRRRAALVVCNTYHDLLLAGPVARVLGIPVIWRSRGEVFPFLDGRAGWRIRLLIAFLRRGVSRILTTTAYDRRMIIERGVPAEKVHLVRLGVDATEYMLGAAKAGLVRQELGVSADAPLIGFVGRLVPQKGHLHFLDALAQVRAAVPEVRALIVGDTTLNEGDPDGLRAALVQRTRDLGLEQAVIFTGLRRDIPAIMNAIDLLAHASLKEPFGTVLLEAMVCGKAVVASDTRGPREIVEEGVTGHLIRPGDAQGMARAMIDLLQSAELRKRMGEQARERVRSEFDLQANTRRLDEHCLDLLRSRTSA